MDCEKGEGIELGQTFSIKRYPTFVLLDAEGRPIARWIGYGKDGFTEKLTAALSDPLPIAERQTRFDQSPSALDAEKLAYYHAALGEQAAAVKLFREAERLSDDPAADFSVPVFSCIAGGIQDKTFTVADLRAAADAVFASPASMPLDRVNVAWTNLLIGRWVDDPDLITAYLEPALEISTASEDERMVKMRGELLVERALRIEGDPDRAVAYKKEAMPEGWETRAKDLNSFAWWCFESGVNLVEAEELARKGVELSEPGKERAMILDTVAEICHLRGNTAEAYDLILKAAEDDPENEYYTKQVERFQRLTVQ